MCRKQGLHDANQGLSAHVGKHVSVLGDLLGVLPGLGVCHISIFAEIWSYINGTTRGRDKTRLAANERETRESLLSVSDFVFIRVYSRLSPFLLSAPITFFSPFVQDNTRHYLLF